MLVLRVEAVVGEGVYRSSRTGAVGINVRLHAKRADHHGMRTTLLGPVRPPVRIVAIKVVFAAGLEGSSRAHPAEEAGSGTVERRFDIELPVQKRIGADAARLTAQAGDHGAGRSAQGLGRRIEREAPVRHRIPDVLDSRAVVAVYAHKKLIAAEVKEVHGANVRGTGCPFPPRESVADLVLVENAHEIGQFGADFTRKLIRLRRSIVGDDALSLRVIWIRRPGQPSLAEDAHRNRGAFFILVEQALPRRVPGEFEKAPPGGELGPGAADMAGRAFLACLAGE